MFQKTILKKLASATPANRKALLTWYRKANGWGKTLHRRSRTGKSSWCRSNGFNLRLAMQPMPSTDVYAASSISLETRRAERNCSILNSAFFWRQRSQNVCRQSSVGFLVPGCISKRIKKSWHVAPSSCHDFILMRDGPCPALAALWVGSFDPLMSSTCQISSR